MFFKTKAKQAIGAFLSFAMLAGSLSSCTMAYAIGGDSPETPGGTMPNGSKPQGTDSTYINDTPLRLQVSKLKTLQGEHEGIGPKNTEAPQENTITYLVSGRIDGTEADIVRDYGADYVELAYSSSGTYLGYGWKRGTLEYFLNRQAQDLEEEIQIVYNEDGIFDGFAYITRTLETADDTNRYVAGATMALYEAVEIFRDPSITRDDSYYGEDERFAGVTVVRDSGTNHVTNVYVNKGYAGTKTEYVLQKEDGTKIEIDGYGNIIDDNYHYQDAINDTGDGTWIVKTIQREDTPILFYRLDDLRITSNDVYTNRHLENNSMVDDIFGAERYDKKGRLYGFDRDGNIVDITQKDELDFSIYAFETGTNQPVYEFAGGNYDEIRYHMPEKVIEVGKGTIMYHLDQDGNRDSMVDPQTGIAYMEEAIEPLKGHDRIHSVNDTASAENTRIFVWPVNVFYDGAGVRTFQKILTTRIATIHADTSQEYTTGTYTGSSFIKNMNPVLDSYGHSVYYQRSGQTYEKGEDTWDYDGDEYTGYIYKDSLDEENENAYVVQDHNTLYNGDEDNPFNQNTHYQYTEKQPVRITVDADGNFVVKGAMTVPVPVRPGYVFAGWLMEPDQLTDNCIVKAYWRNQTSSGMNETERQQWYSDHPASGTTKIMTITFDANGGEFYNGSGDIHSTDNLLYRRLGDGYLMENVWVTGENTPNDPFDTRKIDTVEHTANGENTISGTGQTGNDVYSSTNAGGQIDLLKRVHEGVYMMEEIHSPAGYVKGLPVGVTVNEDTKIQYSHMVDSTIKVEFVKKDAADSYTKNLYVDGELQVNADGMNVTVQEPKGGWSFTHVPSAVLALKAKDEVTKKAFSDWVKVTGNTRIQKKTENGFYYIEFQTDSPLFLEGIPAGNYKICETLTPAGYVTMEEQELTIYETSGVQLFSMGDDHTKVEIEKYYRDDMGKQKLPNAYRAELTLADQEGSPIASWRTDDLSDYTNSVAVKSKKSFWQGITSLFTDADKDLSFVELFTEKVNGRDSSFNSISWEVTRKAVRAGYATDEKETWILSDGSRIVCENGSAPDTASQEFKDAYHTRNLEEKSFTYKETLTAVKEEASKTLWDQVWKVSNGSKLHVCVYGDNGYGENGRQSYLVDFKFNYRDDYTGIYRNTISYDTIDGCHRFDYLPEGSYLLKETETPEGFVTAGSQTITVKHTGDVQRFTIENKQRQLEIGKVAAKDGNYYAGAIKDAAITDPNAEYAAVIPGASLTLYYSENQVEDYKKAFADGKTPQNVTLADHWTSGTDGKYTESEYKAELIRFDQIGDYKPHIITDIQNGWYYLVETKTPFGYTPFEVMELHVTDRSTWDAFTNIQAVNTPVPLNVQVYKENDLHSPLSGAVFAVKNKTLGGILVGTLATDETGYGSLVILDTGRFAADGKLDPYTFTIEEVSAPAGYKPNDEIHEFTISKQYSGMTAMMENPADGAIVNGVLYVMDEPSRLTISKSDFHDKSAVPGTTLAVYEAVKENGIWENSKITKGDDWTWTIKANEITHEITGLTAGGVYVLTEEQVPSGYTKANDLFFKVSSNGAAIEKVWYDPKENVSITFTADSTGAVHSVTFSTRTVLGSYVELEDLDCGSTVNKGTLKGGVVNLSSDDVEDGHSYQMREYVRYSDGTTDCLGTTNFIAKLYNNWMKIDLNKEITGLTMEITDEKGDNILTFTPDTNGSYTVVNPLQSDPDGLTVVGSLLKKYGVNHTAVQSGNQIRYQITYEGSGKEIVILPAKGLTYISTPGFTADQDGTYHMVTVKDSGTLTIIATVDANAAGYVNQQIYIDGKSYCYLNPIAVNHGEGAFRDSSKLVVSSAVAGTHPDNENAAFTFRVTLTMADGSPLSGSYDYRTRYTNGQFYAYGEDSQFEVTVNGNDFIAIHDLPYNTKYSVVQIVSDQNAFTITNTEATGKTSNTKVSNVLFTNTRNADSERTQFVKNTGYVLSELLGFIDSDARVLNQYGFSFGENCQIKDIGMFNKPTEAWFTKTDWTNSEELEGAVCVLLDEDGNVVKDELGNELQWISGKEPKKFVGVLEAGKTYRYHEKKAPDGYGYSEDIVFTVSMDGTINKVIMQDKPSRVSFSKEDFAGNEVLGAVCELKGKEKDGSFPVIDRWVSGTRPHEIEGILIPEKTYRYHEAAAPDGYAYSEDIEFTLDKDGKVMDAHYINEHGYPILYDQDGYPTTIVVKEDGSYIDGETILTIDPYGNAVDENGVIHAKGVQYELAVLDNVIQMKDAPTNVVMKKVDDKTGLSLAGATLQVRDKTGKIVAQWITDHTGRFQLVGKLHAGETYILHEEATPDGYYYSYDVEFTVNKTGKEQVVEMRNRQIRVETPPDDILPKYGEISKRDAHSKKELAGAKMQIINEEGMVMDSWISNGTSHQIPKTLPDGEYTITELEAPAGYQKAEDVKFTVFHSVVQSGTVLYDRHDTLKPPAPPQTPGIYICKLDQETNVLLEGAHFEIRDESGDLIESWESDHGFHKVSVELPDGIYTLKETKAPSGYRLAEDVLFTVSEGKVNGQENGAVKMYNKSYPPTTSPDYPTIWLLKNSVGDPSHILKGGTFQVLDENGKVVIDTFTMDGTGQNWNVVLIADHRYRLHEVTPPEGYQLAQDVWFTVSHYGEDIPVIMTDSEITVTIRKIDERTGLPLEGAELELYKGKKKEPYAAYDEADLVARWTTNETGIIELCGALKLGETYTLHESVTVKGYYYSYDQEFTLNHKGEVIQNGIVCKDHTIIMGNRPVIVETPPDELPPPVIPESETPHPGYTLEKNRTSLAPEKLHTGTFGFFNQDRVYYDVTIRNTGNLALTMDVNDRFEKQWYFTMPEVDKIRYYESSTGRQHLAMGQTNEIHGSKANITIQPGGYAIVTYKTTIKDGAKELLSYAAPDDGLGYVNVAFATHVTGKYYEYSGEDQDGDGKPDDVTEKTVSKKDYPEELGDKEDESHTPIQKQDQPEPWYTMRKERIEAAPTKTDENGKNVENRYGFRKGDLVTYQVTIQNTGDMPLKMYVSDEFAHENRTYFENLKITSIHFTKNGSDISENGMGMGTAIARIRIEPGETAEVIYTAVVSDTAPERLSYLAVDDGNGYLNRAKTYQVKAEKPDGTEGGHEEYPGIPDKEDESHTPVQNPEKEPETPPPGPDEPSYPVIWLLKKSANDPSHILPGGTFQVLDENGTIVIDTFAMDSKWQVWNGVLEADQTYYLHEVTPPEGYTRGEDIAFTVSHYGEPVEVVMTDETTEVKFLKIDEHTKKSLANVVFELYRGAKKEPYAKYDKADLVGRWITDSTGLVHLDGALEPGKTYTLHEAVTVKGYYYSYDQEFTLNEAGQVMQDGKAVENNTIVMQNRPVIVETPPDELPPPIIPKPETPSPDYTLKKERTKEASEKKGTGMYGFFKNDIVNYDVTIMNTGNIELTMDVMDAFEQRDFFSVPRIRGIQYYESSTGRQYLAMGQTNSIEGSKANITIQPGGYAVLTYQAFVLPEAQERLSNTAADDGAGYVNTVFTTNVTGKYYEYSGEDKDGGGRPDDEVEKTVTKEDYPEELGDKEDKAHTPVQEPESPEPSYAMDKKRMNNAPVKTNENQERVEKRYGFKRGDIVTYKVTITNTGDMTLKMYVSDEFAHEIRMYFRELKISKIHFTKGGSDISEDSMGVGTAIARIRIEPGETAEVIYTAVVSDTAPERLSYLAVDDGNGYLNRAKTYQVKAEKPDGTEGGYKEYPGIPDKEDESHTPVQNPEKEPETPPPGPEEPSYPVIWLLKKSANDPSHILPGGTFQVLDGNKNVVIEAFQMDSLWQAWYQVLEADQTYYLHEVTPPEGYTKADDVAFTVSHYGEPIEVLMTDSREGHKVTFTKEDNAGKEIPGATCELLKVNPDGSFTRVDKWISDGSPRVESGMLEFQATYRYHEELAPEGYGCSEDVEFTLDSYGVIKDAHYVDRGGNHLLCDKDGDPTTIIRKEDGTYVDGEHTITIDQDGNAVDENGEIRGEGVKYKIPVIDNVIRMKDSPTKVLILKVGVSGKALSGGEYQILDANGLPAAAIKDTIAAEDGTVLFEAGKELIFTAKENGVEITGQLKSGTDYILRELKAPAGYRSGEDVRFHVPGQNQKEPLKVTMEDAPTKVQVLKTDEAGKGLSGAKLEIRDAINGDLMDAWVSDGNAHDVTGILTAGKEYFLIEEAAPEGYYRADRIRFTVMDTENVQTITMKDEPVAVQLVKVKRGTTEQLKGGKFSVIRKSDSAVVIPEFELNGELTIIGKLQAGITYLFHEAVPPSGYLSSEDVEFTIPVTKAQNIITVTMENTKKPSGGGGNNNSNTPTPPTIHFKKYDGMTMKALSGAEFTIYDDKGKVYQRVTTDESGYATVNFSTPGTYSYQETKAPDGYEIDHARYTFEVLNTTSRTQPVANYATPPNVTITKKDGETGDVIPGVRFEITNETGQTVFKGITDSYGQITFKPDSYGAYAVREIKVPKEYQISEGYITFTVGKGGIEGETIFYNSKKRKPPIEPGKKSGIIEATYDNGADGYGKGWFDRDGKWHPFAHPGKTGDFFPFILLGLLALFGGVGLILLKKNKEGEDNEET